MTEMQLLSLVTHTSQNAKCLSYLIEYKIIHEIVSLVLNAPYLHIYKLIIVILKCATNNASYYKDF